MLSDVMKVEWKKFFVVAGFLSLYIIVLTVNPVIISEPGPLPDDPAQEDLTRIVFPSQANIQWDARFVRPDDSLRSMFGRNWEAVARFNRIDRRHIYPGMTLKVPRNMKDLENYFPVPRQYERARRHEKYILVDLTEQWLGAYEYGKLVLSIPLASGSDSHKTPTGFFRIDGRHRWHTSSLYKTEDETGQYPMDYAMRFHIDDKDVAYWIHARDLPGHPGSHGCIGVYDESMQNRVYGFPKEPVLLDAERLYDWAVGEEIYEEDSEDFELVEGGPVVEIVGDNPKYHRSFAPLLTQAQ